MGVPEMEALWEDLVAKEAAENLDGDERQLLKKLQKTLALLARLIQGIRALPRMRSIR